MSWTNPEWRLLKGDFSTSPYSNVCEVHEYSVSMSAFLFPRIQMSSSYSQYVPESGRRLMTSPFSGSMKYMNRRYVWVTSAHTLTSISALMSNAIWQRQRGKGFVTSPFNGSVWSIWTGNLSELLPQIPVCRRPLIFLQHIRRQPGRGNGVTESLFSRSV